MLTLLACAFAAEYCVNSSAQVEECLSVQEQLLTRRSYILDFELVNDMKETITVDLQGTQGEILNVSFQIEGHHHREYIHDKDIGHIAGLSYTLLSTPEKSLPCSTVRVLSEATFYEFGCAVNIQKNKDDNEIKYFLNSGGHPYEVTVNISKETNSGSSGCLYAKFSSEDSGEAMVAHKLLGCEFIDGGSIKTTVTDHYLQKIDLVSLYFRDISGTDPASVANISVSNGKDIAIFEINGWIGGRFGEEKVFSTKHPRNADPSSIMLSCTTKMVDLLVNVKDDSSLLIVICPPGCKALSSSIGSGVHPGRSPICASALNDGLMSFYGGKLALQISFNGLTSFPHTTDPSRYFELPPGVTEPTYAMVRIDSIDDIPFDYRIINESGALAAKGILQTKSGSGKWGSVTVNGPQGVVNPVLATTACGMLGFPVGEMSEGLPTPWSWVPPIIATGGTPEGELYMLETESTSPASDLAYVECETRDTRKLAWRIGGGLKMGILEHNERGEFWPVCSTNQDVKALRQLACREMGFNKALDLKQSESMCAVAFGVANKNMCPKRERKLASELTLGSAEEAKDCTRFDTVLISCEGNGNGTGRPKRSNLEPIIGSQALAQVLTISCDENTEALEGFDSARVGTMWPVLCDQKCYTDITGTLLYSKDSSICAAAEHAGLDHSQPFLVVKQNLMKHFIGTKRGKISSGSLSGEVKFSYTLHTMTRFTQALLPKPKKPNDTNTEEQETAAQEANDLGEPVIPDFSLEASLFCDGLTTPPELLSSPLPRKSFGDDPKSSFSFTLGFRRPSSMPFSSWTTLVSHSRCGGFSLGFGYEEILIIEQICNPDFIKLNQIPIKADVTHRLGVSYSATTSNLVVVLDGARIFSDVIPLQFSLYDGLNIGQDSLLNAGRFTGYIENFKWWNSSLSTADLSRAAMASIKRPSKQPQAEMNQRMTISRQPCVTECSDVQPKISDSVTKPVDHTLYANLTCLDTLESNTVFAGMPYRSVVVKCPKHCLDALDARRQIEGVGYYSSKTAICMAGLHSGIIGNTGGYLNVSVLPAMAKFDGSVGAFNILSLPSTRQYLRSFSLSLATAPTMASCTDTGLDINEVMDGRLFIQCPAGCLSLEDEGIKVYGTTSYRKDSSICVSAIHAGMITAEGGDVLLDVVRSPKKFRGTVHQGVSSLSGDAKAFTTGFRFGYTTDTVCYSFGIKDGKLANTFHMFEGSNKFEWWKSFSTWWARFANKSFSPLNSLAFDDISNIYLPLSKTQATAPDAGELLILRNLRCSVGSLTVQMDVFFGNPVFGIVIHETSRSRFVVLKIVYAASNVTISVFDKDEESLLEPVSAVIPRRQRLDIEVNYHQQAFNMQINGTPLSYRLKFPNAGTVGFWLRDVDSNQIKVNTLVHKSP